MIQVDNVGTDQVAGGGRLRQGKRKKVKGWWVVGGGRKVIQVDNVAGGREPVHE